MPRKPRLHIPGGFYHVILRGNARQEIFFDDDDRNLWETLLAKGLSRYGHRIHAYCWMTNHVHMAVQCAKHPVSHLVRDVASQYARSTNRKMRRTGHLFERRHRLLLIQADNYLTSLVRYIHQNPVCAGLVDDPQDYMWSSHRAYLGHDTPDFLMVDRVLSMFGDTRKTSIKRFTAFVQSETDERVVKRLSSGDPSDDRLVGDDAFARAVTAIAPSPPVVESLDEIVERVCAFRQSSEAEIASTARNHRNSAIRAEIALAATETGAATLATVARRFNRSESVLSRSLSRMRAEKATS